VGGGTEGLSVAAADRGGEGSGALVRVEATVPQCPDAVEVPDYVD
jgi:hypothetical protein